LRGATAGEKSGAMPTIEVFGFIAQPDEHIFLKPSVTRTAAREPCRVRVDHRASFIWVQRCDE